MGSCQIQHLQLMKGMNMSLSEENRLARDATSLESEFLQLPNAKRVVVVVASDDS
jgi:hypothetical protein